MRYRLRTLLPHLHFKTTIRELVWVVTIAAIFFAWRSDCQRLKAKQKGDEVYLRSLLSKQYELSSKQEITIADLKNKVNQFEEEAAKTNPVSSNQ